MQESVLLDAFREYESELLRFLSKRFGSASIASDIAQNLYVKLLNAESHPEIRNSKAYLFSMAVNLGTDQMRVEKRRKEILAEVNDLVWYQADEVTPERHAMAKEELSFLVSEVSKLPERCRKVFYLNRYEGRSQSEIATMLGVGLSTVHKDLKAAMNLLIEARQRFRASLPEKSEQEKK
ncbi:MAG: RNA polymerase sigma factor [Candidatus Nitronauta litoralis]|uniref:RNA polymerase sigma factor n=1 Tax=Candidatus Nitronauta litoralis TaxID=2705533 RepID=A0A7T0G003_9BACT|nr:MAG: RNA polymerase sigma factor [Candidatus Nitronauta litoralis]